MKLTFTKMHGLGNDFVVIDGINQTVQLSREQIRRLADRHFGIGYDQLLLIERPTSTAADFRYRIFNADGGEVEHCGNGVRCFARFVHEKALSNKSELSIETQAGLITTQIRADGQVDVQMGQPVFNPAEIPFDAAETANHYSVEADGTLVELTALSLGNPHAVIQVDDIDTAPVESLGPLIESHPRFPQRVNVGFMQIVTPGQIRLRVFERGVGETLACGTGACAAVVTGIRLGLLDSIVEVLLPGGQLTIEWPGEGHQVQLSGPAVTVFEGVIEQ